MYGDNAVAAQANNCAKRLLCRRQHRKRQISLRSRKIRGLSGLTAFFQADLARFGAFDLAAARKPLVAKHPQCLDLGALAATLAVFEYLDVARAGHTVFVRRAFLGRQRPPQNQKFADVLDRRGMEFIGQRVKNGFSRAAVIR